MILYYGIFSERLSPLIDIVLVCHILGAASKELILNFHLDLHDPQPTTQEETQTSYYIWNRLH